jgi:hypothetical protein
MHVLKDTEENAHQLEVRSEGVLEVWTKKAVPGINVATSKATTINAALWHATLVTLKPTYILPKIDAPVDLDIHNVTSRSIIFMH